MAAEGTTTGATGTTGAAGAAGATGAGGAGAASGNQSAGGNTGAAGSAGTPPSWFAGFSSEENRGFVEHKGYKDPEAVVNAYRNLEKLHGVPAEKLLRLPDKMDDDKDMAPIYDRLGRPAKADDYAIDVPEGGSEDFAKWARGQFHELGLSKKQGEKLAAKWNDYAKGVGTKMTEERSNTENHQMTALKQEWGQAFEQNRDQVNAFAEAIGLKADQAAQMAGVLGVDGLNKMLHGVMEKFGIRLGESNYKDGGGQANFSGQVLSPAAAKVRLQSLKADSEWTKKYLSRDKDAVAESDRLHQWAYGG